MHFHDGKQQFFSALSEETTKFTTSLTNDAVGCFLFFFFWFGIYSIHMPAYEKKKIQKIKYETFVYLNIANERGSPITKKIWYILFSSFIIRVV